MFDDLYVYDSHVMLLCFVLFRLLLVRPAIVFESFDLFVDVWTLSMNIVFASYCKLHIRHLLFYRILVVTSSGIHKVI